MKVIRDEDKNSNKYIMRFEVEKGTIQKNTRKNVSAVEIATEDYNNLVVYMADGSKPRYDNIEENKVRLLQLMTEQHLRNKVCEEELDDKYCKNIAKSVVFFIGALIVVAAMVNGIPNSNHLLFANAIRIVFPTIILAYGGIKAISAKKIYNKIKDMKKNDYLLENEEVLNQADLNNKNILENVKDKDKTAIAKIKQEKDKENEKTYFDNNSIDGLSLDALRKIKANIERENYLGLVRTDEETKGNTESKGKSYVKKGSCTKVVG